MNFSSSNSSNILPISSGLQFYIFSWRREAGRKRRRRKNYNKIKINNAKQEKKQEGESKKIFKKHIQRLTHTHCYVQSPPKNKIRNHLIQTKVLQGKKRKKEIEEAQTKYYETKMKSNKPSKIPLSLFCVDCLQRGIGPGLKIGLCNH